MYDQLLFVLGEFRVVCDAVWPTGDMKMWSLVFMVDWVRDIIPTAMFIEMMELVGPDYKATAECMVEARG